jgi:hypothetical protein
MTRWLNSACLLWSVPTQDPRMLICEITKWCSRQDRLCHYLAGRSRFQTRMIASKPFRPSQLLNGVLIRTFVVFFRGM